MMLIRIRIVIPCYNEAERLPKTIKELQKYLKTWHYADLYADILIVNDGSTDKTLNVIKRLVAEYENVHYLSYYPNKGKGYAVRSGVLTTPTDGRQPRWLDGKLERPTHHDYIIFMDADGSSHMKFVMSEISLGDADIIMTNRELPESNIYNTSRMRFISSHLYYWAKRILLSCPILDTQNGLKAYKSKVAKKIFELSKIDGFSFDVEVLHIARLYNKKIHEVPVDWHNTPDSRVSVLKHSPQMLTDLFKIRFNTMRGVYRKK